MRGWCTLWVTLLLAGAPGVTHADAVSIGGEAQRVPPRTAGEGAPRHTYVILAGYPSAPDLPDLSLVDSDVGMMYEFFQGLAPERVYVHLPDGSTKRRLAGQRTVAAEPPTYAALVNSAHAIAARIDEIGAPADVYFYYAGHGKRLRIADHVRTTLFVQPSKGDAPGDDGLLSTALLQRDLVGPLARRGSTRVHLIIDACQSFYVLEARGMVQVDRVRKVHPGDDPGMARAFERRFPQVGALLATNGSQVTYEDSSIGGLFSYAVRSAAIGLADLDGDARVTYGELARVLPEVLGLRAGAGPPGVVAPGGRHDVPFVDYRGRSVAAVDFAPLRATRYELHDNSRVAYAVLYPDAARPVRAFFPIERLYLAAERYRPTTPRQWFRFVAANGPFDRLREPAEPDSAVARGARFPGLLASPLPPPEQLVRIEPPRWVWRPQAYLSVAIMTEALAFPVGTGAAHREREGAHGFHLVGGHGLGQHQFSYRLGWSQWTQIRERHDSDVVAPQGSFSYGWLLKTWPGAELSVGGYAGAGVLIKFDDGVLDRDRALTLSGGGLVTTRFFLPGSPLAVRLDGRVGGQLITDVSNRVDLVTAVGAGLEYEFGLD